jgi:hypothetical protein
VSSSSLTEVRVLTSSRQLQSALAEVMNWADCYWLAYAWASGADAPHMKALDLNKLALAVVGVDGCNTEPEAITMLHDTGKLRIMEPGGALFHPKLLVAQGPDGWRALVGSSNLTGGGFKVNIEANVLIADAVGGEVERLRKFIEGHWKQAAKPTSEWLTDYEVKWQERQRQRQAEVKPPPLPTSSLLAKELTEIDVGWDEYYRLISGHRRTGPDGRVISVLEHDGDSGSYIDEIEACQRAFKRCRNFGQLNDREQKLIAGWPKVSSGYLGRLGRATTFMRMVEEQPATIGTALDPVPPRRNLSATEAAKYIESLSNINGVGVAAWSRLLTVKRPDRFLPANRTTFAQQRLVFGKKPDNALKYMEMLERVWQMPWFNAPEPQDEQEKRIWKVRVALLDALFYAPKA